MSKELRSANEDIYAYHFSELYKLAKSLIGTSAIKTDKETDLTSYESASKLLFDICGFDFNTLRTYETEYRGWVEVYILKIIENILSRSGIWFEERFYGDGTEQNSIIISLSGKLVEAFFLFDITYGNSNNTDYDKISSALKQKAKNVDEIHIYIFRDSIGYFDLASLINKNFEMNDNGYISVFPIKAFFDLFFDDNEYSVFLGYAEDFYIKCNKAISYKTVITPSPATLKAFRHKKMEMLRDMDYKKILDRGQSGYLAKDEFAKVQENFIKKKMYLAMVSSEDYAESFISAEWSYDVYQNAMGELELTGIIAGYLKSIEQLLFAIAKFHENKGLTINSRSGHVEFTTDNEDLIDSTLGSLNSFITSPNIKLACSAKIRGCIRNAISNWTQCQRNGYFHKHNLYSKDNKIKDVRELTIYLYFLILGGLQFTPDQIVQLGVFNDYETNEELGDTTKVYPRFKKWFDDILNYDLPDSVPGLWLLSFQDEDDNSWIIKPYLMKYFYMDDFASSTKVDFSETICTNHIKDIPPFKWKTNDKNQVSATFQVSDLFSLYFQENAVAKKVIQAIMNRQDAPPYFTS